MNSFTITVTNCLDCPDHDVRPIYTPDSWDHEEGCYCKLVKDQKGHDKLVAGDLIFICLNIIDLLNLMENNIFKNVEVLGIKMII